MLEYEFTNSASFESFINDRVNENRVNMDDMFKTIFSNIDSAWSVYCNDKQSRFSGMNFFYGMPLDLDKFQHPWKIDSSQYLKINAYEDGILVPKIEEYHNWFPIIHFGEFFGAKEHRYEKVIPESNPINDVTIVYRYRHIFILPVAYQHISGSDNKLFSRKMFNDTILMYCEIIRSLGHTLLLDIDGKKCRILRVLKGLSIEDDNIFTQFGKFNCHYAMGISEYADVYTLKSGSSFSWS